MIKITSNMKISHIKLRNKLEVNIWSLDLYTKPQFLTDSKVVHNNPQYLCLSETCNLNWQWWNEL